MPPLQVWISIIEEACFYALIALGYFVVLTGAGFFNFAVGPYAMVAGLFTADLVSKNHPIGLAIVLGVLAAIALSIATDVLVIRPVFARVGGSEAPALVAVLAVLFVIEQGAGQLFGRSPKTSPAWLPHVGPFKVSDASINSQTLLLCAATAIVFIALGTWLRYSTLGKTFRAIGDSTGAARILGLPVQRIRLMSFAIAGAIAGLAGVLIAPKAGVAFDSGLTYALYGFLALVIGGTASVWGPIIGGLLLSAAQLLAAYNFGGDVEPYVTFLLAAVLFALRPRGLFERRLRL